jgi:hypothetical protein
MENTTFNTEFTVKFINTLFKEQIKRNSTKDYHTIFSDIYLCDFDNTRNEIDTYYNTGKKSILENIYNLSKDNYEMFETKIQFIKDLSFKLDFVYAFKNKIQIVDDNNGYNYLNLNQLEILELFSNISFSDFCKKIIDYIDEMQPKKDKPKDKPNKAGRKTDLKYTTFESMFTDKTMPEKVINELIDFETLSLKGELLKEKYYILAITEALQMLGIINKDVNKTNRNKLFANKFNTLIADKTTRTENENHEGLLTEYKELFNKLL